MQDMLRETARSETQSEATIVPIDSLAGYYDIERLQKQVWGQSDRVIVPTTLLYAIVASGGILLGAYVDDEPAGFVLGLMAQGENGPYHASHMLGIHPRFQSRGLGAALKHRQREVALAQGLHTMTWTFDPLEARNAYFNLHKLGAVTREYRENHYGMLTDELNGGMPSDRLLVEWALDHPKPTTPRVATDGAPRVLSNAGGDPKLDLPDSSTADVVRIDIPTDVQRIKHDDPGRAMRWRLAVRAAFLWAVERDHVACDFADGSYLLSTSRPNPAETSHAH